MTPTIRLPFIILLLVALGAGSAALTARADTTAPLSIIDIDWALLLEQRPAVLAHCELPNYLLLPEVHQLLDAINHDNLLLMMNTLWHTGARISECLALTADSFKLDARQPYVSLQTLKKRGRPSRRASTRAASSRWWRSPCSSRGSCPRPSRRSCAWCSCRTRRRTRRASTPTTRPSTPASAAGSASRSGGGRPC